MKKIFVFIIALFFATNILSKEGAAIDVGGENLSTHLNSEIRITVYVDDNPRLQKNLKIGQKFEAGVEFTLPPKSISFSIEMTNGQPLPPNCSKKKYDYKDEEGTITFIGGGTIDKQGRAQCYFEYTRRSPKS